MSLLSQQKIKSISNRELINRIDVLVQKEHEITIKLLVHLSEMDRRRVYLERGFASLFEYCTRYLGYSEAAANRRIRTARCIAEYPEVHKLLEKKAVNLTTVSRIAGIITDKNKYALLKEASNKSKRQVEAIVARYNPKTLIRDRVKTVYLKSETTKPGTADCRPDDTQKKTNPEKTNPNWVKFTTAGGGKKLTTAAMAVTVLERKFKLEFAVSPEVMAKIEEVKTLLSTKFPKGIEFEQLLNELLVEYLNRHSPKEKIKRRKKRQMRSKVPAKSGGDSSKTTRHIPAEVRDRVYQRDRGCCTYVDAGGRKCSSKWNLQIDHIVPYGRGGDHAEGNLRLLCAKHNRLEAKRVYGEDFMRGKMPPARE